MTTLLLQFDGATEPTNPGGVSSAGWIIYRCDAGPPEHIYSGSKVVYQGGPESTNNAAEWCALGFGLRSIIDMKYIEQHRPERLLVQGDSQNVVRWITGEYQCRVARMAMFRDRVKVLLGQLGVPWDIEWIPREQNGAADQLSRMAWTQATGKPFPERRRKPS